jgi:uncharacterized protein (TIGR00725 family)
VAVIGPAHPSKELYRTGRWVGRLLAAAGAVVVTGGRGGVMEAASRGAIAQGGDTVGILPGNGPEDSPPNAYVEIPVFTGMGDARNAIVVRTGDAVIAIGGGFGTLSEIGLALKAGRPVVLLDSWGLQPPEPIPAMEQLLRIAQSPREAVNLAVALAGSRQPELDLEPPDDRGSGNGEDRPPRRRPPHRTRRRERKEPTTGG